MDTETLEAIAEIECRLDALLRAPVTAGEPKRTDTTIKKLLKQRRELKERSDGQ